MVTAYGGILVFVTGFRAPFHQELLPSFLHKPVFMVGTLVLITVSLYPSVLQEKLFVNMIAAVQLLKDAPSGASLNFLDSPSTVKLWRGHCLPFQHKSLRHCSSWSPACQMAPDDRERVDNVASCPCLCRYYIDKQLHFCTNLIQ